MSTSRYVALLLYIAILVGCASHGKYINTRGVLDENIYYLEMDKDNDKHFISSAESSTSTIDLTKLQSTRVPQPALVDMDSTIQILMTKERLVPSRSAGLLEKQSKELLKRKKAVLDALILLEEVVQARYRAVEMYQKKDFAKFMQAKKEAASIERSLIRELTKIWTEDTEDYFRMEEAYDPPSFSKLQEFLKKEIATFEAVDRTIEEELDARRRTLMLEAFLSSPGKETIAVHIDGYDLINEQTLKRRDRFGLDLSKEEREKLDAQVSATQDVASALERLRRGEISLNEAVQQIRADLSSQIAELLNEAERLYRQFDPNKMRERKVETEKLFKAYLDMISVKNEAYIQSRSATDATSRGVL